MRERILSFAQVFDADGELRHYDLTLLCKTVIIMAQTSREKRMPTKIAKRAGLPPARTRPAPSQSGAPRVIDARVRRAPLRFKRTLRETYGKRFRGLYLYGSYARGDARPDSDVDTVIALAGRVQPYHELARLSRTLADLCLRYDLLIATYPVPETWSRERESPLFENIRREGVRL